MLWLLFACTNDKDSGAEGKGVVDSANPVEALDRPTVSLEDMMGHLTNLDAIAQDNSNNRALGTAGGQQTQNYLKQTY